MRSNPALTTPVDELFPAAIHAVPRPVEEWDIMADLDEQAWNFFEAIRCEVKTRTIVLVCDSRSLVAACDDNDQVVHIGTQDENIESYVEDNTTEDGDATEGSLSEREIEYIRNLDDVDEQTSGPQMNYWYPVEGITDPTEAIDAAIAIKDLPLCIVEVNGTYGLALCGGGMDMSWDICRAYVTLGYLPPIHFADLPNLAGEGGHTYVWQAMIRGLEIAAEQAQREIFRLRERFPHLAAG